MKKFLLLFVIVICFLITACQPTPSTNPVVGKNDNMMYEKINESQQNDQTVQKDIISKINAPETFTADFTLETGKLSVKIDANILIPNVNQIPVIEIVPDKFDVEKVKSIRSNLFGDVPVYNQPLGKNILTKKQIEEKIMQIRTRLNDPNADFNQIENYKDQKEYDQRHKEAEEQIKKLEKQYQSAPETVEYEKIEFNENILRKGFQGFVYKKDNNEMCNIFVSSNEENLYRSNSIVCAFPKTDVINTKNIQPVTEEDIISIAKETLTKLNPPEMGFYGIFLVANSSKDNYRQFDVVFTRIYQGISETFTTQEQDSPKENTSVYTYPWFYEKIIMRIDNFGVLNIQWLSPSKVQKTLSKNVEIFPFTQVMDRFKKQMGYGAAWEFDDPAVISRKMYIDEIRLGMMRVNMKDSIDKYMVIPVWDFFGYTIDKYSGQQPGGYQLDENNEYKNVIPGHSYLTINAIDGSIIDRTLGY